jgi:sugar diacid utilization regulator
MAEVIAASTNGTLDLPLLAPATRQTCLSVADQIEAEAAALGAAMAAAVFREVPIYRDHQTDDLQRTVVKHSVDHVYAVVRTIRTWSLPTAEELAFVRTQGALRATQQLPLNALLHTYRLGHRTVWERLVQLAGGDGRDSVLDAVVALTSLTLGYTDLISSALAEGYLEQQRLLVLERDRDRRDLLENLLHGDVNMRSETLRLAATFDLLPNSELLVAVLCSANGWLAASSEVLTRAAETVRRQLSTAIAQPLVVIRQHEVVAVLPIGRGRPKALAQLIRAAHAELSQRGERWAAGVSTLSAGLAEVRRGYEEARQALEWVRDQSAVAALLELRVSDYLLERADATSQRMVPSAADDSNKRLAADRALVETLLAYADADMAVRPTAERICVHPNTVTYRLDKIRQLVGRDPTRFSDLVELLTWTRLCGCRKPQSGWVPSTATRVLGSALHS